MEIVRWFQFCNVFLIQSTLKLGMPPDQSNQNHKEADWVDFCGDLYP